MPEYEFETVRMPGVRAFIDQCKALPAPSADGENTARCTFVSEPFLASGTVWILEVSGDYEGTLSVYLTLAVGSQSTSTFFFNVNIVHPVQAGRTFSRDFWDEFRAGTTRGLRSIISFDDLVEQGFLHPRQPSSSSSSSSSSPSTADKTEVDVGESDVLVIRYGVAPELYKQKCDNQQQYIGELESTVRKLQLEMDSMTSAEPQQPQSPEEDPYLTPQHRLASTLNQSNQNGSAAEIIAMLSPTFSAATLPARSARSNGNNGFTIATSSNEALVGAQYGDGLTSPLEMTAFDSAVPPAVPQSNIVDFGPASVPPPDPAKSKDAINNDHDDWDFLSSSQRVDFPQSSPSLSSSSFTASSSAEIEAYLDKDRASERHQQQQHHSHQQHQQQQQQQQQQHQFRRPAGRSLSDGSQLRRYMEDNEESFDGDGDISSGLSGSFASSSLSASFTALPDAAKQYNNDTAVSLSSSQRARRSSYDSPGNDIMGPMSGQGLGNARLRSVQNRGSNVGVAEESRAPQTMDSSLRAAVIRNVNHILARRQSGLLDRSHNRSNAGSASSGQSALTRPAAAMPVQSTTGVDQPRTPVASENTFIPTNMIPSINQTTSAPSAQHQPAISNAQQQQTQQHQQQQHQQQQQQTKPRSSLRDRRISTLHKQVTFRSTPLVFPGTPRQWGNTSTSSTASSPGSGSSGSGNHRIKSALRNSPRRSGPTSVRHKIAARGKGHVRLGSKTGSGTSKHGSSKDTGLTLGDELNSNDDDDDDDDDLMLHSSEISEIATMQVGNMAASVDSETDGSVGNLGHSFDESRIRQLDQSVTLLLQRAQNDIATVQKTPAASSQYSYPQRSEGGISSPPPIAPSRNHRLRSDSYDGGELQAAAATSSAHSPPVPAEPPMSAIIAPVDVHSSRVKYADHQAPQIDEADPSVPVLLHHLQSASGIEALLRRRRTDPQFAARIKEEYSEYQRSRVRRPLESDPVDIDASAMIMVNGEVGIRVEALRKAERERRRQTFDPSELSFAANAPQAGNAAARQTTGDAGVLAGTRHSNPTTTTATTAATAVSIHRDERGGGGRLTSDFARRRRTFAPMSSGEAPAAGSTAAFPTLANNSPPQYTQLHRRSWIASRSPDSIAATMALGANPGQSRYQHGYYGHSGGGNGEGGGSGEHAADSLSSSTEQSASGSQHVDLVGSVMIPVMDSTAVAALRNLSNDGYYQQSHHRTSSAAPSTSSSNHPSASTSKPTSPLESAYRLDPLPQSRTRASTAITDANQPMQDANQHQSQLQAPRSESISRVSRLHRSPPVIGSHLSSRPIHSSGSGNGGGGGGGGGGSGLVSRSRLNFGYSGPGTAMGSMSGGDNSSNEDLARSVAISVSQIAQPRLSSAASAASASSSSSSSNPTVSAAAGIQLNKRTSFVGNLNGRGGQQMSAGSSSSSTSYRNLSPTKSVSRERPSNTSGNSSGSGGAGGGIGDGSTSSSLQRLSASRTSSTATVSSVNSSLRQQPQPQRGSIQSMARHQQQQLQQQQPSSIRSNADSARLLRSKRLGQTTASATLSNPDYGDVSPSNNDASRCLTSIFNQPAPHQS
ncbi:hypothetical protein GQ42DRAFT_162887 [Ramicandelaber brevisporus]|nr:hypothetical protein GQ42DRAFT_162887 [Ramicandelaber brevisporus]